MPPGSQHLYDRNMEDLAPVRNEITHHSASAHGIFLFEEDELRIDEDELMIDEECQYGYEEDEVDDQDKTQSRDYSSFSYKEDMFAGFWKPNRLF